MLIDLKYLCNKYNFIPNGIIHIGAHLGEEHTVYSQLGINEVVWIEANPDIFRNLVHRLGSISTYKFINSLISDIDNKEFVFKITNNGESSSILDLETHKIEHPHIHVTNEITLKSMTIDSILELNNISNNIEFMNLDIQGAELLALKGSSKLLDQVKYIYSEVNEKYLYKDCALINEIDDFLTQYNFERVETKMLSHGWGDAFYIKKI